MINRLFILLIGIAFVGCSADDESQTDKQYFDFDKIIHYKFEITDDEVSNLYELESLRDSLLNNILIQDGKEDITDTLFFNSLENLSTTKTIIDTLLYKDYRNIFKEKRHPNPMWESCIATWRDIIIFKKEELTIGIAKICFDCQRSRIIGTTANTDEFGQGGDYEKLYKLLYAK